MKWLDVVKKHIKLNPGKSIKDLMPEIKKEYYNLSSVTSLTKKVKSKKVKSKKVKSKKVKSKKNKSKK